MVPLLCHLNQCPEQKCSVEELLQRVYQEDAVDFHSIKKVQVAAARINKKLMPPLLIVKSQEISINNKVTVVIKED